MVVTAAQQWECAQCHWTEHLQTVEMVDFISCTYNCKHYLKEKITHSYTFLEKTPTLKVSRQKIFI